MTASTPRAFTLLELVIVIALIGILATVVVTWLANARERARATSCASNLTQIAKAMYMYADVPANKNFPTTSTTTDPFAVQGSTLPSQQILLDYIGSPILFSCPCKPLPRNQIMNIRRSGTMISSYSYDPGHGPNDADPAIMADKKGTGANSDNHGAGAGQNVLIGAGTVEFRETVVNPLPGGLKDTDIFQLDPKLKRNLDAYIRH